MAGCVGPCGRMTHLSGTLQTQARPLGEAALRVLIVRRALRRRTAKIVAELASRSTLAHDTHTPRNHSAFRSRTSRTRATEVRHEFGAKPRNRNAARCGGTPSRFDDGVALGRRLVLVYIIRYSANWKMQT